MWIKTKDSNYFNAASAAYAIIRAKTELTHFLIVDRDGKKKEAVVTGIEAYDKATDAVASWLVLKPGEYANMDVCTDVVFESEETGGFTTQRVRVLVGGVEVWKNSDKDVVQGVRQRMDALFHKGRPTY